MVERAVIIKPGPFCLQHGIQVKLNPSQHRIYADRQPRPPACTVFHDHLDEVNSLICSKRRGTIRIISFIDELSVIRDILKHLGLWQVRLRPPPKIHELPNWEYSASGLQPHPDIIYGDPEYTWDDYIQP